MPYSPPRYLNRRAAAEHLGVSYSKLSHVRDGMGPPFSRWPLSSIVRYDIRDLDAWMAKLKTLGADGVISRKCRRGAPSKSERVARRLHQDSPTIDCPSGTPGKPKVKC